MIDALERKRLEFVARLLCDDTELLQAMIDAGEPIIGGHYRLSRTVNLRDGSVLRDFTITMPDPSVPAFVCPS